MDNIRVIIDLNDKASRIKKWTLEKKIIKYVRMYNIICSQTIAREQKVLIFRIVIHFAFALFAPLFFSKYSKYRRKFGHWKKGLFFVFYFSTVHNEFNNACFTKNITWKKKVSRSKIGPKSKITRWSCCYSRHKFSRTQGR